MIKIQPFTSEFLTERYVSWLNDKVVVRFSEQRHREHTLESCAAYYRSFAGTPHRFWAILNPGLGHIGNMTATVDPRNQIADLAILIGERAAWGRGFGTEAWRLACRDLLSDLRKVTAGTMAINQPMLSVMRKSGMQIEGIRKRHFLCEGQEVDLVFAGLWSA